jgi:hypothetical protein
MHSAWEFQNGSLQSMQVFAFLTLLAIFLQGSFLGVITSDACPEERDDCLFGPIADETLRNFASAARRPCSGDAAGGYYVPWSSLCDCLVTTDDVQLDGGSWDGESGSWMEASGPDLQCVADALKGASTPPAELESVAWIALGLEIFVFLVVFAILFMSTRQKQAAAAVQSGGAQVATVRGTIVGGTGLRSGHSGVPYAMRSINCSQRYAVLSVSNPAVQKLSHREQQFKTPESEDDPNPTWNHDFTGMALYADSKKLEVKVYDQIAGEPVLIGTAGTEDGNGRTDGVFMDLDQGMLPDLGYKMNGDIDKMVTFQLYHQKDENSPVKLAGSLQMILNMYPVTTGLLSTTASVVTGTGKYEVAILAMVLLSMLDLALWSPAVVLSPTMLAGLNIIELFIGAEMIVELIMEVSAARTRGESQIWKRLFFVLGLYNLISNYAWLFKPDILLVQKAIAVGRVTRLARGIERFRIIDDINVIEEALESALGLFKMVFMLMLLLTFMFAVIGMSCFGGALQFECLPAGVQECDQAQKAAAVRLGTECPVPCPMTLACVDEYKWPWVVTPTEKLCAPVQEPLPVGYDIFGIRDFDNIWRAMVTVLVQATGDGGMHTIPLALAQSGAQFTSRGWLFSFIISILLNLVSLNLFLSVVCSAYSRAAARAQAERAEQKAIEEASIAENIATELAEEREARIAAEEAAREKEKSVAQRFEEKDWVAAGSPGADFRMQLKAVILSDAFETGASLIILANTVTMLMAHDGMSDQMTAILGVLELFFLFCYITEAIMIFIAQGSQLFFESSENRFDIFVVITSIMGTLAEFYPETMATLVGGADLGSVQSFRAVRLLRALQLVRLVGGQGALMTIMGCIFKAWRPIVLHLVFCGFFMAVFAITGMHLFGGALFPEQCGREAGEECTLDDYKRELPENFESFEVGFLTVFELTVGLEWSKSMYWYTDRASAKIRYPQWLVQVYFLGMVIWMNCILFSMFTAILIHNFGHPEDNKFDMQKRVFRRQERRTARMMLQLQNALKVRSASNEEDKLAEHVSRTDMVSLLQHHHKTSADKLKENKSLYIFSLNSLIRLAAAEKLEEPKFKKQVMKMIVFSCVTLAVEGRGDKGTGLVQDSVEFLEPWIGASYFSYLNVLVLLFFMAEGVLKVITHGFIFTSGPTKPYLKKSMDQVDFFIILVCAASYLPFDTFAGPWARALRITAVARLIGPMLDLTDDPQIALVLISFGRSLKDVLFAMLPIMVIGLMFAIVGVSWFTGILSYCAALEDPLAPLTSLQDEEACDKAHTMALNSTAHMTSAASAGSESWSNSESGSESGSWNSDDDGYFRPLGFTWETPALSFDNSATGMASLLVAATDGTHEFMLQMARVSTSSYSFWVSFHLVFTCFFVNIFLCVPVASFAKNSGRALMTLGEQQMSASTRMIQNFEPGQTVGANIEELRPSPRSRCLCYKSTPLWWFPVRTSAFRVGTNDHLEKLFQIATFLNAVVLATDVYPVNHLVRFHSEAVTLLNLAFLCLGAFEVTVKLIGFGPSSVFSDGWLVSDIVLVHLSIILAFTGGRSGIEVFRCIRVARIYGVTVRLPGIVALIDILMACLKASLAVIVLVALTVYIYSIMGMYMFGSLPSDSVLEELGFRDDGNDGYRALRRDNDFLEIVCPSCTTINPYTNFNDFIASSRSLMQLTFGQGIRGFVEDLQFLGSGWMVTYAYFASFYILTVWVFLNILVATVLRNFDAANTSMSASGEDPITPFDLDGFAHTWAGLSIGVHRAKALESTSAALLRHLRSILEEEEEGLSEGIMSPCFEDGADGQTGTLSVTVDSANGLSDPKSTPYCAVTLCSRNIDGRETQSTRTSSNRNGNASFKPRQPHHDDLLDSLKGGLGSVVGGVGGVVNTNAMKEGAADLLFDPFGTVAGGATAAISGGLGLVGGGVLGAINSLPFNHELKQDNHIQFHVTTFCTHLMIQLREGFQFEDSLLGAISIPMSELKEMKAGSQQAHTFELLINDDGEVKAALEGEPDRWKLYNTDASQVGDVDMDGDNVGADSDSGEDDTIADREGASDGDDDEDDAATDVDADGSPEGKKKKKMKAKKKKNVEQKQTYAQEAAAAQATPTEDDIRATKEAALIHSQKLQQASADAAKWPDDAPIPKLSKKPKHEFPPRGEYPSDDEDDEEVELYKNPYEGWRPTGIKLNVAIEFLPLVNNVPKHQWIKDHTTINPRMEATCGTEGWLEISEEGQPFKQRYCFLQNFPEPCFKFYRDAKSGKELERRSRRNKLRVQKILGKDIMSLCEGHDVKTYSRRNQFHHNFQMEAEEQVDGGGLVEERVGFLTGEIVRATNLTETQAETTTICKRIYFEAPDDGFDSKEDEDDAEEEETVDAPALVAGLDNDEDDDDEDVADPEEDDESDTDSDTSVDYRERYMVHGNDKVGLSGSTRDLITSDAFNVEDRADQTNIEPTRYMAASRTTVRLSPTIEADKVGTVTRGNIVTVTAFKVYDGVKFLKTDDGWIAGNSEHRNNILMIAEDAKAHYYRVLKEATIGKELSIAESAESEPVGTLPRGCVVEIIASKKHMYRPGQTSAEARADRAARSAECHELSIHELKEKAQEMGIDIDDIVEALDTDNPKSELIDLILDAGDIKGDEVEVMRHKVKCDMRGLLYGGPSGSTDGWISETDLYGSSTTDTYCVVETVPAIPDDVPNLRRITRRATQKAKTLVIEDDLDPDWNTGFAFNVYNSCSEVKVTVFEEGTDDEVGSAMLSLGMVRGRTSRDGIPGPVLQTPAAKNVELSQELSEHTFPISIDGSNAGQVTLRLGYEQLISHAEIFEREQAALERDPNASLVSCMMVPDTRLVVIRLQAPNPVTQRSWLAGLKWVAKGCPQDAKPRDLIIPTNLLTTGESKRAERDLSLVDLPFSRVGQLLHGLYLRRVMGRHKPTLRNVAYTIFQLETHCFGANKEDTARKQTTRGDGDKDGVYLADFRGLRFNATLERLVMTHYGKRRCLSYRAQVEEYEVEARSIATQIIRTMVSRWVFKTCAKKGLSVRGQPWPYHSCWRKNPELYAMAADAACAQRMYTLNKLWTEVQRQSRPETGMEENDQVSEALSSINDPKKGSKAAKSLVESPTTNGDAENGDAENGDAENGDAENGAAPTEGGDDTVAETPEGRKERITAAYARVIESSGRADGPADELEAGQLVDVIPLLTGVMLKPSDFKLIINAMGWTMYTWVSVDEFAQALETFEAAAVDLLDDEDDQNADLDEFDEFGADPREALRALVEKL